MGERSIGVAQCNYYMGVWVDRVYIRERPEWREVRMVWPLTIAGNSLCEAVRLSSVKS